MSSVAILSVIPGALLFVAGILGTTLVLGSIMWDAARAARRAGADFAPRAYNRWYVYLGAFLVSAFGVQPAYLRLVRRMVLQAYQIPSSSMEPTLLKGDFVLASPLRSAPARGAIVVYRRRGVVFMKRVVGLPSDTLRMQSGTLLVNGRPFAEPYASHKLERSMFDEDFMWQRKYLVGGDTAAYHPTLTFWGPIVVPTGQYFVLGDNRGESADSRFTGFVTADSIIQRPIVVYLSRDPDTHNIRWRRIGMAIK